MTKLHSLHCSLLSVWRKGSAFAELMCRGVTIWVWQHSGTIWKHNKVLQYTKRISCQNLQR